MSSTYVVELTPSGRSSVAVVLVAGPEAVRVVNDCFVPASGRSLIDAPLGRIMLGRWASPGGEELIVCRRSETQVEIHCHGGAAAVRAVVDRLTELGCVPMSWQEWLRQAERDPPRAAAQIALAEAPTARTAAILLDQYHGALSRALQIAIAAITAADWSRAAEILHGILRQRGVGLHLTTPWRVVLAGPPNVGKSSLLNAIAGYQRAIVSPTPGTTRDVVTVNTAIDGWPVQLADTAGLREGQDELESAGVEMAAVTMAGADLIVMVYDASEQRGAGSREQGARNRTPHSPLSAPCSPLLHVCNKIDLVSGTERDAGHPTSMIATSAVTGEGIAELVAAIGHALVPTAPPAGAALVFTVQQVAALDAARTALDRQDASAAQAALQSLLARGEMIKKSERRGLSPPG